MRAIVRFFAKEHLLGNLLTLLIFVFGIYSVIEIRRDIWPGVDFNITTITTLLPGASPEQVEKLVINPIEEAIREVDGLKKVFSTATESTGVSVLQLDPDARDANKTNQDIRQAIDRVDDLPDAAERPILSVVEAGTLPVIEVTLTANQEADPQPTEMEVRDAGRYLSDELSLLRQVSSVNEQGERKKEFLVEAAPELLARRRVPLSSLIQSIQSRNVSVPGGSVKSGDGREVLVRTEAEYPTPESLLETVLLSNEAGFGTKLGDVASVKEQLAEPTLLYRYEGRPSANLIVAKKVNADTYELIEAVKEKAESFAARRVDADGTPRFNVDYSNDLSGYLTTRLNALSSNLIVGLVLVVIVLALFLPWQVTLVVALGIPVALLSTLATAYLLGISLNLISLIGLIIVLGMLVDDAIVVTENIWRHVEMGKDLTTAVVEGAGEVFGAVLASVLTTASAFAPMMFMTGIFGAFVFEIPVMVILALFFSIFEAFIVMPSHFTGWVGPFINTKKAAKSTHWFDGVAERYQAYVKWSLRFRYALAAGVFGFFVATAVVLGISGRFILFPPEGIEAFFIQLEAPTGTTIEKMVELVEPIEQEVAKIPEVDLKDYVTSVGIIQQDQIDPQTRRGSHYAQIRVLLTPQSTRERTANEIIDEVRKRVGEPEEFERISIELVRQGPPQGKPISLNVLGDDFEQMNIVADKLIKELRTYSGVEDVRSSFLPGKDEWQVLPLHQATAMVGLTAAQISQTVRAAFEGIVASSVRELDEEIDIRVRLKPESGYALNQLETLSVGNSLGNLIPLRNIAKFKKETAISSITHLDYRRLVNVSANVDTSLNTPADVVSKIKPKLDEILAAHEGVKIEFGGEDEDTAESMTALARAFIFAAFVIFSLLIITFKNLLQPILILTSIPLGFMGVAYAMLIHGRPFSFMAMLGVIALAGVIVNNAIVFIDFVNSNRKDGQGLKESIAEAAKVRLRPIVLTTLTTVCGLLPTAYGEQMQSWFGIGGGDPFIVPIALSLGWGLAFGSLLTALVFPAFILILDDIENGMKKLFTRG